MLMETLGKVIHSPSIMDESVHLPGSRPSRNRLELSGIAFFESLGWISAGEAPKNNTMPDCYCRDQKFPYAVQADGKIQDAHQKRVSSSDRKFPFLK